MNSKLIVTKTNQDYLNCIKENNILYVIKNGNLIDKIKKVVFFVLVHFRDENDNIIKALRLLPNDYISKPSYNSKWTSPNSSSLIFHKFIGWVDSLGNDVSYTSKNITFKPKFATYETTQKYYITTSYSYCTKQIKITSNTSYLYLTLNTSNFSATYGTSKSGSNYITTINLSINNVNIGAYSYVAVFDAYSDSSKTQFVEKFYFEFSITRTGTTPGGGSD